MDFELSEEQRIGLESFRKFVAAEVAPVINRYRSDPMPKAVAQDLFRKLAPFGLGSGWVPEEDGGFGIDLITSGLLYEELSRVSSGLAAQIGVNDSVALLLHKVGTPEQKSRYLPGLLSGDLIASIAVTEPGVGSCPAGIRTRAVRDGDVWRINGEKVWISNADISDIAAVVCRIDDAPSLLLVERSHGYSSRNFEKLGQREKSTGQLVFEDVKVPLGNLIGRQGDALRMMARSFERARCLVAFSSNGIAAAALDASLEYARNREQWGKPIAGHQLVQAMLAEMATELDCSRLLALRAMATVRNGQRSEMQAAMAKWYASEMAVRVASNAIQIHGAYGFSTEFPVERYLRDARMMTIPDGTTQIQKLIIGRSLTGLAAFQ